MTRSIEIVHPWIYRIRNFLSDAEFDMFVGLLKYITIEPRHILGLFDHWLWIYPLESLPTLMSLFQEAFDVIRLLFEKSLQTRLTLNTKVHLLEIKPGQDIQPHMHSNVRLQGVWHLKSLAEMDGGRLEFFSSEGTQLLTLSPEKNSAIIFDWSTIHSVTTNNSFVTRYSVSFWYKEIDSYE